MYVQACMYKTHHYVLLPSVVPGIFHSKFIDGDMDGTQQCSPHYCTLVLLAH